jgi:hypothetical protein
MISHTLSFSARLTAIALFAAVCFPVSSPSKGVHDHFQEGCCLNPEIKPVESVSHAAVSARVLAEALNCATNNISLGNSARLAKELGGHDNFNVSYFYGKYMPEQETEMLTVAVYSEDERTGYLFDIGLDDGKYDLANLPELRNRKKQWQVGEINGGIWSYTRLWYLAQEVGTRSRQRVTVSEVLAARPKGCSAMNDQSVGHQSD